MKSFQEWLVTEGIPVNYQTFQNMSRIILLYGAAIEGFHKGIISHFGKVDPLKAQYFQQYFDRKIMPAMHNCADAYVMLNNKVGELMQANNWKQKADGGWGPQQR